MSDRDLRLRQTKDGRYDLDLRVESLTTVEGRALLVQALSLRLLTYRGELGLLGHPRYGSRVEDLIGRPLDRPNLGLLKRYVRKCLRRDPRVSDVPRVEVATSRPGLLRVSALVVPVVGSSLELEVTLDV